MTLGQPADRKHHSDTAPPSEKWRCGKGGGGGVKASEKKRHPEEGVKEKERGSEMEGEESHR